MGQEISLNSIGNARELGGYINTRQEEIRHGVLLRTAALDAISDEDRETLRTKYQVAFVIDFRMTHEREKAPDPEIGDAVNLFFPVTELSDFKGFDPARAKEYASMFGDRMALLKEAHRLGMLGEHLYADFLLGERGMSAYRGLFECLLKAPEGHAVLWHCTDGKDRTGIAAMLILSALQADRETILADYMLTNRFNEKRIAGARASLQGKDIPPELMDLMLFGSGAVYENYMNNALDTLEARYGSVAGYLDEALGIGASECRELRRKFLMASA